MNRDGALLHAFNKPDDKTSFFWGGGIRPHLQYPLWWAILVGEEVLNKMSTEIDLQWKYQWNTYHLSFPYHRGAWALVEDARWNSVLLGTLLLGGKFIVWIRCLQKTKKIKNKKHHHSHKVTLPSGQSFLEGPIAEWHPMHSRGTRATRRLQARHEKSPPKHAQ